MEHLGLNNLFENVYVSSEIGFAKPDKRAFQYVLKQTGVTADKAIMVDDSARNIDSAKTIGIQGIIFNPRDDVLGEIKSLVSK